VNSYILCDKCYRDGEAKATLFDKIRKRDRLCVYCHKELKELHHAVGTPSDKATVEHMDDNSVKNPEEWNVAMCCGSCNSSRGAKKLPDWFKSKYCTEKNINESTVSEVVRNYMNRIK